MSTKLRCPHCRGRHISDDLVKKCAIKKENYKKYYHDYDIIKNFLNDSVEKILYKDTRYFDFLSEKEILKRIKNILCFLNNKKEEEIDDSFLVVKKVGSIISPKEYDYEYAHNLDRLISNHGISYSKDTIEPVDKQISYYLHNKKIDENSFSNGESYFSFCFYIKISHKYYEKIKLNKKIFKNNLKSMGFDFNSVLESNIDKFYKTNIYYNNFFSLKAFNYCKKTHNSFVDSFFLIIDSKKSSSITEALSAITKEKIGMYKYLTQKEALRERFVKEYLPGCEMGDIEACFLKIELEELQQKEKEIYSNIIEIRKNLSEIRKKLIEDNQDKFLPINKESFFNEETLTNLIKSIEG